MSEWGWGGQAVDRRKETCPVCEHEVTSVVLPDGNGRPRRYIEPHAACRGSYRPVENAE